MIRWTGNDPLRGLFRPGCSDACERKREKKGSGEKGGRLLFPEKKEKKEKKGSGYFFRDHPSP